MLSFWERLPPPSNGSLAPVDRCRSHARRSSRRTEPLVDRLIEGVRETWHSEISPIQLTVRDIRVRYKEAVMG